MHCSGGLVRPGAFSGGFPHPEQWASQAGADLAARAAIHPYLPRCNGFVVWSSAATNRHSLTGINRMWVSPLFALREADATSISPHDGKAVLGEE